LDLKSQKIWVYGSAMTQLSTFEEVFDELGRVPGLIALTGSKPKAVGAWQTYRRFPWKTYPIITAELQRRGKSAPEFVWGMKAKDAAA
jgi:hypothetical protein